MVEGEVLLVELVVAAAAHEDEFVDVGFAFGGCVPGGGVVHLAAVVTNTALHAAFVADNERKELSVAGMAGVTPEPQRLTVTGKHRAE